MLDCKLKTRKGNTEEAGGYYSGGSLPLKNGADYLNCHPHAGGKNPSVRSAIIAAGFAAEIGTCACTPFFTVPDERRLLDKPSMYLQARL